ncbi:hypothetical protein E2C01_002494 [Portunus trituberculatus]|uniref:Uncharacterized protein n=1 Tax=Portunus trituberculatus TaxID=210409 RepID=A0A5B7CNE5_PORTR|nr:hypothetical protein [Portunus trituberculatus]
MVRRDKIAQKRARPNPTMSQVEDCRAPSILNLTVCDAFPQDYHSDGRKLNSASHREAVA